MNQFILVGWYCPFGSGPHQPRFPHSTHVHSSLLRLGLSSPLPPGLGSTDTQAIFVSSLLGWECPLRGMTGLTLFHGQPQIPNVFPESCRCDCPSAGPRCGPQPPKNSFLLSPFGPTQHYLVFLLIQPRRPILFLRGCGAPFGSKPHHLHFTFFLPLVWCHGESLVFF